MIYPHSQYIVELIKRKNMGKLSQHAQLQEEDNDDNNRLEHETIH